MDMRNSFADVLRRLTRFTEGPFKRKRIVILILSLLLVFLYILPRLSSLFSSNPSDYLTAIDYCQEKFLSPFEDAISTHDAHRRVEKPINLAMSTDFLPYTGNGYVGVALDEDPKIYIKYGRSLSIALPFNPLHVIKETSMKESTVVEYNKGLVHRFHCSASVQISYQYFAHRTVPHLFVQHIFISNPSNSKRNIKFISPSYHHWLNAVNHKITMSKHIQDYNFEVVTGSVDIPDSDKVIACTVVSGKFEEDMTISARDNTNILLLTVVKYSDPVLKTEYTNIQSAIEKSAIKAMERAVEDTLYKDGIKKLIESHVKVWQTLWYTGFSISESKAPGVLNGDKINATMYAVLSQVRSHEFEEGIQYYQKQEILKSLTYSEGCYGGHTTLDAGNLWKSIDTVDNLNSVVNSWVLTLEKQGCHNLLGAGASGTIQAMVLSFGSLRFANQHLEYNDHPSNLHRDFLFRRVNYGNMTHLNISVQVQEDNKAAIFVALDRSDRKYYACDAGCLDKPVLLGQYSKYFPVKLTEPLTSILYITADKQHMEELQHALHLKLVVEAPAHEDHVIAQHKHGHKYGGLSPLFWVSICLLIVVFHVFLIRIVMTEYFSSTNYRRLYNKPR